MAEPVPVRRSGVERLVRAAEARRTPIPLPWIRMPRDVTSLSGIILVVEGLPEDMRVTPFWESLREHLIWMCRKYANGEPL